MYAYECWNKFCESAVHEIYGIPYHSRFSFDTSVCMALAHNLPDVTCMFCECEGGQLADVTSLFKKFSNCVHNIPLTFEGWGWDLHFSAWFTKKVLLINRKG
jgi:hypothetical protein